MFWFYLSGIVILAGGEINAILEDAAAQHKIPEREGADIGNCRRCWSSFESSIPLRMFMTHFP